MLKKLKQRIEIQERTSAQGATHGDPRFTWTTLDKVWADVHPVSGSELLSNDQVLSEITHKVTIRYKTGINTTMRIFYKSRYFDIESVINLEERNKWLELLCSEKVN